MLNTNPSKPYRVFKHVLILPLLAVFLMAFSREDVYIPEYLDTDVPEAVLGQEPNGASQKSDATETSVTAASTMGATVKPENSPGSSLDLQAIAINKVIQMTIDKGTTDAELLEMKDKFAADDIDFSYTTVRNDAGEITSLEVDIKGPNFSGNYASEEEDGIDPMVIRVDDEGGLFVGTAKSMSGTELHKFHTSSDKSSANVWVHRKGDSDENEVIEIREVNGKKAFFVDGEEVAESEFKKSSKLKNIIVEVMDVEDNSNAEVIIHEIKMKGDDGENEEIIEVRPAKQVTYKVVKNAAKIVQERDEATETSSSDSKWTFKTAYIADDDVNGKSVGVMDLTGDSVIILDTDSDKEPLIFIDGKKASRKAMDKLNIQKDIEKIEVINGEKAIEEYGKKAKDGVILITTKKG